MLRIIPSRNFLNLLGSRLSLGSTQCLRNIDTIEKNGSSTMHTKEKAIGNNIYIFRMKSVPLQSYTYPYDVSHFSHCIPIQKTFMPVQLPLVEKKDLNRLATFYLIRGLKQLQKKYTCIKEVLLSKSIGILMNDSNIATKVVEIPTEKGIFIYKSSGSAEVYFSLYQRLNQNQIRNLIYNIENILKQ